MGSNIFEDPPKGSDEHKVRSGREAKLILDSPGFKGAVLRVEQSLIAMWRTGKTVELRETAFAQLTALQEVVKQLRMMLGEGEYVQARTDRAVRAKARKLRR